MDLYKTLAEKAKIIKAQMKVCNKDGTSPKLETFEGFLTGVMQQIDDIVASRSNFPETSLLQIRAIREWDGQYQDNPELNKLVDLLGDLDFFIITAKYTRDIQIDLSPDQKDLLLEVVAYMLLDKHSEFFRYFYHLEWAMDNTEDDVFMDMLSSDDATLEISQSRALSLFNAINSLMHITEADKLQFNLDDLYDLTGKLSEQVYAQEYSFNKE